jgi:putative ABC transport system permease protein
MLALLRHGLTSLRRTPTVALTISGTLAIALAATVVVFSFLNSFLLRPLPYGDSSRIAVVYEHSIKGGKTTVSRLSGAALTQVVEHSTAFARTAYLRNESVTVHAGDTTEVDFVQRVSPDVFPLLALRPSLGSAISRANAETAGVRAAVLSDALWRRRFGADPSVIGRVIQLDDKNYQVVGVMPADFKTPSGDLDPQAWLTLLSTDVQRDDRVLRRYQLWGELAPGRMLGAAEGEVGNLGAALRRAFPGDLADRGLTAISLRDDLLGTFGRQLVLLQGAVLLVLVVACFNCFCLLIARGIQRRREFAVRLALGAARHHLFAQLFAESLWLALPAAALGCLLAEFALPLGVALLPPGSTVNLLAAPHVDFAVAAVVTAAALAVALAFSLVPLWQTRRLNLEAELRQGGRSIGSPAGARLARGLAAGQIAVALALLISAALLVRSQRNLAALDPGFAVAEFDMFRVGLRGNGYRDPAARLAFYDRMMEQLRTLPGVRDVTAANFITTTPPSGYSGFVQEGDGLTFADTPKRGVQRCVAPNFFSVFGLRLVEGRSLADTDVPGHPVVAVINASLAAKYWPGQSPLGKRVRLESPGPADWVEIVGVVSDVLGYGNQPQVVDGFYLTIAQYVPPGAGMGFYLRHHGVGPDQRTLERAVWAVDPNMQFFAHATLSGQFQLSAWQSRFVTRLVAAFALVAVALSLAGIYAVNAFFVARRINEFGVRVALGATGHNILGLVLRDSLRLTLAGLAVGTLLALAASRGLANLLFGVPTIDVYAYVGAALLMTAACLGAAFLPARRAAKVDPLTALRAE